MNFSFKRNSELYVVKDGIGYLLNSVADFSLNQTVSEKTINRKSQFASIAPKSIINRSKNLGSGSIEVYFNRECLAIPILLETLDFTTNNNAEYTFDNNYTTRVQGIDIVLFNRVSNTYHRIIDAVVTNLDFGLSASGMSRMVFGIEFSDIQKTNIAVLQPSPEPEIRSPSYIDFKLGTQNFPSVVSAAFTITRSINRLNKGATQFNLGSLATPTNPVVTGYDITAMVTSNMGFNPLLSNNGLPFDEDVHLGNKVFFIDIPNAKITSREEPSEVFKVFFDIKHQSLNSITLGGYS